MSEATDRINLLDRQIKGRRGLTSSVLGLTNADDNPSDGTTTSKVFDAEAAKGMVAAIRTRSNYRATVDAKAAITGGTLLPTSGTGIVPGLFPNGIVALSGLFPTQAADGPTVRYYRMDSALHEARQAALDEYEWAATTLLDSLAASGKALQG